MEDIRKPRAAAAKTGMREVVVEDFSENEADFFQDLKKAQEQEVKIVEKKQSVLSEAARQRVEQLCGLTRATRDIPINGKIFVIQSIKSEETESILLNVAKNCKTDLEASILSRKLFLANAISKIDNVDINIFLSDSSLEARLELLGNLGDAIINKLYDEYNDMMAKFNSKFANKEKAEEAMKEVAEDIKK